MKLIASLIIMTHPVEIKTENFWGLPCTIHFALSPYFYAQWLAEKKTSQEERCYLKEIAYRTFLLL